MEQLPYIIIAALSGALGFVIGIVHRMGCKIMPPGVPAPPKGNVWIDGHEPEHNTPKL